MKKTLLVLLVLLTIVGSLAFSTGQQEGDSKVIAMVPKLVHPYYEPCWDGFKDAAEAMGYEAQFEAPPKFGLDLQVKTIEDLIARGVAGITISAVDDAGLVSVIKEAMDAGIKIITFDAPAPSSAALSYIGTINETAGYEAGKEMVRVLGGQGEVALIQAGFSPNLSQRDDGFKKALADLAPNMKVVAIEDNQGDLAMAVNKAEALLEAYPNLKGIFGISAYGAPGAAIAVKEQGRTDIVVAGFDDLKETLDFIREGVATFCLVQKTYKMGWLSVVKLDEAIKGKTIEKEIDTGVIIVNKANIDSYMADMIAEVKAMK